MSSDYPVPFEYCPLAEAIDRARQNFSTEAAAQLKGMLIAGRLQAWSADASGAVSKIDPPFWVTDAARRAIEEDTIHIGPTYRGWKSAGRPVFLCADLDAQLPSLSQQMAAMAAKRRERSLNSRAPNSSADSSEAPAKKKSGRSRNPDADLFLIEAARMAFRGEQGPPQGTQEQFIDAMEAWANKHMDPPYKSDTVAEKVELLWRSLWPRAGQG